MSQRTHAPASADAGTGPPDATTAARDAGGDAPDPDEEASDLRTATRLLRVVKLALGALVSLLTALRLLGLL